jgi:DNA-binding SARP family transcriptional activator
VTNSDTAAKAAPIDIALAVGRSPKCLVEICLLGSFRLTRWGSPTLERVGTKSEALLAGLALAGDQGLPREVLLERLWPDGDSQLARQSLNSLLHALRALVRAQLGDAAPVLKVGGFYRLNLEAGVGVDVMRFDDLADTGDRHRRLGDESGAARLYARAVEIYRGDLSCLTDIHAVVERERLRSRYMELLARLGDYHFAEGDPTATLSHVLQVLKVDPCREDAHRLAMRSYVRLGQRAQALRQYRVCEIAVRGEFDTEPEPATTLLFEQVRLDPQSV